MELKLASWVFPNFYFYCFFGGRTDFQEGCCCSGISKQNDQVFETTRSRSDFETMVSQNATEEEEEEEDFMSDKFLQDPATTKAGSTAAKTTETYSERRRREVDRAKEQSRILSRAEREKAARKRGLGRSLIEIAEGKGEGREERGANGEVEEEAGKRKRIEQDQGDEEVGQGESKALRMMKAMGYVTGDALGKKDGKAKEDDPESAEGGTERGTSRAEESRDLTAPLAIDERWIGARVRHGIGIVSRSIHEASEKQAAEAARGDLDDFRKRATREHEAKHCEALLRRARKTCEDLDRQQDVEVRSWPPNHLSLYDLAPSALNHLYHNSIRHCGSIHSSFTSRRKISVLIVRS